MLCQNPNRWNFHRILTPSVFHTLLGSDSSMASMHDTEQAQDDTAEAMTRAEDACRALIRTNTDELLAPANEPGELGDHRLPSFPGTCQKSSQPPTQALTEPTIRPKFGRSSGVYIVANKGWLGDGVLAFKMVYTYSILATRRAVSHFSRVTAYRALRATACTNILLPTCPPLIHGISSTL